MKKKALYEEVLTIYATLNATAYKVSIGLPGSLSLGSYAPSLRAFQIKYIRVIPSVIPSPHLTLQNAHTILARYT